MSDHDIAREALADAIEASRSTSRAYTLERARTLTAELDAFNAMTPSGRIAARDDGRFSYSVWMGRANAILKELTRDA